LKCYIIIAQLLVFFHTKGDDIDSADIDCVAIDSDDIDSDDIDKKEFIFNFTTIYLFKKNIKH
jgi:hypothetical protein